MLKTIAILLLPLIICSCSSHKSGRIPQKISNLENVTVVPADALPACHIRFKKDVSYGGSKNVLIGRIDRITVDDSGKVFILDGQKETIDVFKADGQYLTHLGLRGRGPGEFKLVNQLTIISNKLYAYDWTLKRENVFSTDSLALIRTINLKLAYRPDQKSLVGYTLRTIIPRSDGMYIAKFIPNWYPKHPGYDPKKFNNKYYLISTNGKVVPGEIFEQRGLGFGWLVVNVGGKTRRGAFNFMPHSLIAISDDGHFYLAWDKEFLIKEYNPQGDYLQSVYSFYNNVPLVEDSLLNDYKEDEIRQNMIRNVKLPTTWPALNTLKIDDQNRLWASTIVRNKKVYQWWVLNQNDKLLARFTWPRSKPIKVIKNGYLYTQETDTTGIDKVVRYRIEMEPSGK